MEDNAIAIGASAAAVLVPISKAVANLLEKLAGPAVAQTGLMVGDLISGWRLRNLISIMERIERLIAAKGIHVHPRLLHEMCQRGSLTDDEVLQDMWAGILAYSATDGEPTDVNLELVSLLSGMSAAQAKILSMGWESGDLYPKWEGGGAPERPYAPLPVLELLKVTRLKTAQELEIVVSRMAATGLLSGNRGPSFNNEMERVGYPGPRFIFEPTHLSFRLYVACSENSQQTFDRLVARIPRDRTMLWWRGILPEWEVRAAAGLD